MVGLTGVDGGSLMTPILVLLFGTAPAVAVGTDLWFAAITKMAGGAMHHSRVGVDWQVVRRLSLGSLPMAVATLLCLHFSGAGRVTNGWLMTSLAMLFTQRMHANAQSRRTETPQAFRRAQPALTVIAGVILGLLVTLTSVGAGALGTVMLVCLYPRRMTPARLVGTDITHAVPLTVVAGTGHLLLGNVNLALLGMLLPGSLPGVLIGSHFSTTAPEGLLRMAIAAILARVGVKLILS